MIPLKRCSNPDGDCYWVSGVDPGYIVTNSVYLPVIEPRLLHHKHKIPSCCESSLDLIPQSTQPLLAYFVHRQIVHLDVVIQPNEDFL